VPQNDFLEKSFCDTPINQQTNRGYISQNFIGKNYIKKLAQTGSDFAGLTCIIGHAVKKGGGSTMTKSEREDEILDILMLWHQEIMTNLARELGVSIRTIRSDIKNLMVEHRIYTMQAYQTLSDETAKRVCDISQDFRIVEIQRKNCITKITANTDGRLRITQERLKQAG
jgi:hypothetical protein